MTYDINKSIQSNKRFFKHRYFVPIRLSIFLFIISSIVTATQTLNASCVTPVEVGEWINANPNTNSITKILIRFVCQDQVLNGELYPPGPAYYFHMYGRCHPTDCDWNETGAQRIPAGHLYGTYDQGFAKRYVYAKMSIYRPGQLWVYTYTDFRDPSRRDYAVHNWFKKL